MKWINRNLIIDCLKELSSRQLQERLWLSSGPPEVSSFTEAVEQLFTDSGLSDALITKETGFSEEVESKLIEIEKQLTEVNKGGDPLKIINDPAMSRVRILASEILLLIRKV